MLKTLEALTGKTFSEAVVLQQRTMSAWVAFIAAFLVAFAVLIGFDIPMALVGAGAGGAGGIAFALFTSYFVVGRADDLVVLARSSRWFARAKEVVQQKRAPVKADVGSGTVTVEVTLFGERYLLSKAFAERFRAIVS